MSVNSFGYIHLGGDIRNLTILLLLSLLTPCWGQDCPEGTIHSSNSSSAVEMAGDSCIPLEFSEVNMSMYQASYFFYSVIIDGIEAETVDWVGIYNNDICTGALEWDQSP